jgi:hypothetical protein
MIAEARWYNPAMTINELLNYLFDEPTHPLRPCVSAWVAGSSRFRAFAELYRDKIRRKIRLSGDEESWRDLLCELELAHLLLEHRSLSVEYEKYGVGKRGPDLTVTYKTHTPFNVEVKRLRSRTTEQPNAALVSNKLMYAVCDKLSQLPPGVGNVVALIGDDPFDQKIEPVIKLLKERAERKDDEFLRQRGLGGSQDFFKYYPRLSAILLRAPHSPQATLWLNKEARHPLRAELVTMLRR